MEATKNTIGPLLLKTEAYCNTSLELLKLKALDKTADVSATLISRLILSSALFVFVMALNVAIALWMGDLIGKNYYGFLVLASFYAVVSAVLFLLHPPIKRYFNVSLITQILK
jgi:hypothetical protein